MYRTAFVILQGVLLDTNKINAIIYLTMIIIDRNVFDIKAFSGIEIFLHLSLEKIKLVNIFLQNMHYYIFGGW